VPMRRRKSAKIPSKERERKPHTLPFHWPYHSLPHQRPLHGIAKPGEHKQGNGKGRIPIYFNWQELESS
jgi:hypothetical protein